MNTGRILLTLAVAGTIACGQALAQRPLLHDVQVHLNMAKRCADLGKADVALAYAAVVTPDRQIRVRVDLSNFSKRDQGIYRNALSGAFAMWETALGQRLFEVTETGQPDVVIQFKPDVVVKGIEVCGHSEWSRGVLNPDTNPTVVFTAQVQVRTLKVSGEALTFEQLRACTAHELGHIIGLDDSPNQGDIMGRMDFNHPAVTIRPEEVATLLAVRRQANEIRNAFVRRTRRIRE